MKKSLLLSFIMLTLFAFSAHAQRTVTGKVLDADGGDPIPGVNVVVKGTTDGTITDIDGKYSVKVPSDETILVFSYVGYKAQEITVGNQSTIDVSLSADSELLEEVVVSAFGIKKDKDKLGYAAQTVSSDKLVKSGEPNVVNALNGKVAGVFINTSSGAPGASANILIRGNSSVTGNNQPLFVVDGIPIDNSVSAGTSSGNVDGADFNDYGKTVGTNRASDINPNDIESITVLKGGAATALYGLRATNGAVIITTKSGKGGQKGLNINFSTSYSVEQPNKLPSFTHNFARGRNGQYSNVTHWSWGPAYAGNPTFPAGTTTDIDGDGALDDVGGQAIPQFVNNYENFWQNGSTYTANVSVAGSGENSTFYTSLGYTDQEGIIPNSAYERLNVTMKGSFDITDKFTVGAYASYANVKNTAHQGANNGFGQGLGYWHHMWDISDNRPWVDAVGNRTWFSDFVPDPRWIAYEEAELGQVDRFIGNFNFTYEINKFINLNYRVGVDTYGENRDLLRPITSPNTTNRAGDFYEVRIASRDVTSNISLSGSFELNDKMNLSYLVGNDIYDKNFDRMYTFGEGLAIQGFRDISNTTSVQSSNAIQRKRIIGLFGEVSFDYDDMLFLSATIRRDVSSTLPENDNSIIYPSLSAGFVFSELMENNSILSFGKLKGSIAQVGNDAPIYSLTTTFARPAGTNVNVSGPPRFTLSTTQGNAAIQAELSNAWEVGAEVRFLDDLIGLDLTYYKRNTVDQILPVPLAPESGYTGSIDNVGEVSNKGIEAVLSFNNILRSKDLQWDAYFNFTRNRNEVVNLTSDSDELSIGFAYWNGARIVAKKGYPLGTIIGAGYKRDDSGNLLLDDNGSPQTAEGDVILGNPYPDHVLAWNNSLSYKGFRFDFTLEWKEGGKILNDAEAFWVYSGLSATTGDRFYDANDANANATRVFDGIIESTGQPSTIAAPLDNNYYHALNSFLDEPHMEDASWLRLRTLSLTYSIPTSVLEKTFIRGLDITFTGRNLWLKTDYSGIDPETSALGAGNIQGVDLINAPNTKSYGVSLRAKF